MFESCFAQRGALAGEGRREKGEGRREKGEGRREKGEGRREKGEGRREKGEGRREKGRPDSRSSEKGRRKRDVDGCGRVWAGDGCRCPFEPGRTVLPLGRQG
ncbi:hypothetical protein C2U31_15850 [Achromobacter sp. AONIH1]|nr:hypothetical protein C2U31_15850 [Achromobacter sp. AONIH1]